jgi:hypothetical protein
MKQLRTTKTYSAVNINVFRSSYYTNLSTLDILEAYLLQFSINNDSILCNI